MPDSQEPSYYEIALTNRQVLVFFVVLLLCVVGSFFSGVWLGQRQEGTMPTIAQASEPEVAREPTEDQTLQELNFFTDDPAPAEREREAPAKRSDEKVAAAGSPETTLLEDVGGSATDKKSARREAQPTRQPSSPPASQPAEQRTRERRASAPTPDPPLAGPARAGGYVIQVFSTADPAQAQKVLNRLSTGGYQAFTSPVDVDGRTMYRVRIGPFDDKSRADSQASRVSKEFRLDTWVTRNE